jgi:hypothetical protein
VCWISPSGHGAHSEGMGGYHTIPNNSLSIAKSHDESGDAPDPSPL